MASYSSHSFSGLMRAPPWFAFQLGLHERQGAGVTGTGASPGALGKGHRDSEIWAYENTVLENLYSEY